MRIEHFEFVVILTIIRPNKIEKKKGLDTHHDNKQGGESKKKQGNGQPEEGSADTERAIQSKKDSGKYIRIFKRNLMKKRRGSEACCQASKNKPTGF